MKPATTSPQVFTIEDFRDYLKSNLETHFNFIHFDTATPDPDGNCCVLASFFASKGLTGSARSETWELYHKAKCTARIANFPCRIHEIHGREHAYYPARTTGAFILDKLDSVLKFRNLFP